MKFLCALVLPACLAAQSALLQVRLVEDGAVFAPGSRAAGLSVEVTDELGKPAEGVAVSVRLPFDGAGGIFANGLNTEVVTTGVDGRGMTSPVRWSRESGAAEVRITAVKGTLRAGTLASVELASSGSVLGERTPRSAPAPALRRSLSRKWVIVGVLAAGAAGAGFLAGRAGSRSGDSTAQPPPGSVVTIGPPAITVGQP